MNVILFETFSLKPEIYRVETLVTLGRVYKFKYYTSACHFSVIRENLYVCVCMHICT